MGKKSKRRAGPASRQNAGQQQQQQLALEERSSAAAAASVPPLTRREIIQARHDPRAEANRLMKEFEQLSLVEDPWNVRRVNIFYSYCTLLEDGPTASFHRMEDLDFLKKVRRSKVEPVFYRVLALWLSGYILQAFCDFECCSLRYYDKAAALCDLLCNTEKERVLCLSGLPIKLSTFLTICQNKMNALISNSMKYVFGGWGPDGSDIGVAPLGGVACDCCGKDRTKESIKVCSCCQLCFYCSDECQRKDWNEGKHKLVCRKKDEFRSGDVALIHSSVGNVRDIFHRKVLLKGPAPDEPDAKNPSHWIFESIKTGDTGIVPIQNLRRIRPGLWRAWDSEEHETMKDILVHQMKINSEKKEEQDEDTTPGLIARDEAGEDTDDEEL